MKSVCDRQKHRSANIVLNLLFSFATFGKDVFGKLPFFREPFFGKYATLTKKIMKIMFFYNLVS